MNRKIISFSLALFFLLSVVIPLRIGAAEPDTVTISHIKKMLAPVVFNHKKHAGKDALGINCGTCHHKKEEGKAEQGCQVCHTEKKEGKKLALKDAYHKTCIDCHKAKAGNAPTKCNQCHAK